jgi:hypothetical protein
MGPSAEDHVSPRRGAGDVLCPECGRTNDSTLRFCARCGYQFGVSHEAVGPHPAPSRWRLWWTGLRDPHNRAASREYRRALPPIYRWRRVAVALLVVAGVGSGIYLTDGNPRGWARDRWSDLFYRNRLVEVLPSGVAVEPADATAKGKPAMLVDNETDAWSMRWAKGDRGCGTSRSGVITLTFEPAVRVRQILIYPGLQDLKVRNKEFRPASVGIAYGAADPCGPRAIQATLDDKVGDQAIKADSGRPVNVVRLAVLTAQQRGAAPQFERLSLTELRVLVRQR